MGERFKKGNLNKKNVVFFLYVDGLCAVGIFRYSIGTLR